jgi:hypothetical protein
VGGNDSSGTGMAKRHDGAAEVYIAEVYVGYVGVGSRDVETDDGLDGTKPWLLHHCDFLSHFATLFLHV